MESASGTTVSQPTITTMKNWTVPQMPSSSSTSSCASTQGFAVSASAACLSHIIHHPLYTLKSQMMYFGKDFRIKGFLRDSFTNPTGFLYRGMFARLLGIMPEKAMKMQTWIIVRNYINTQFDSRLVYSKWLFAGAMAGAATTIIGCPSERIMVYAQCQKGAVWREIKRQGIKGLYEGWTATLYRDIAFNMVFFTTREMLVERYRTITGEDPLAFKRVALGLPAGCLASIVGCPFDVIKTRMQGKGTNIKYRSCYQIYRDIVTREGYRYLMKGLLPRLIAVPSMMSVFYVINEELERVFI